MPSGELRNPGLPTQIRRDPRFIDGGQMNRLGTAASENQAAPTFDPCKLTGCGALFNVTLSLSGFWCSRVPSNLSPRTFFCSSVDLQRNLTHFTP